MNELMMTEESPVKVIDEDLTKYHFKKANFYCLRCGAFDIIIKDDVKFFGERNNHRSRSKSPPLNEVEKTLNVSGSLYCPKCKHTYFVKIFDEGIK
jgi:transposase-like protein